MYRGNLILKVISFFVFFSILMIFRNAFQKFETHFRSKIRGGKSWSKIQCEAQISDLQ